MENCAWNMSKEYKLEPNYVHIFFFLIICIERHNLIVKLLKLSFMTLFYLIKLYN